MRVLAAFSFSLLALIATASSARADDYGPHRDIRAIRGAAPVLLAAFIHYEGIRPSNVTIWNVVVNGDQAIVEWSAGPELGLLSIRRYAGRWRLIGLQTAGMDDIPRVWSHQLPWGGGCAPGISLDARADVLPRVLNVSASTAALGRDHIGIVREESDLARVDHAGNNGAPAFEMTLPDCRFPRWPRATQHSSMGYHIVLTLYPGSVPMARFTGDPVSALETPRSGVIYQVLFALSGHTTKQIHGTLTLWAPVVLNPARRYHLVLHPYDGSALSIAGSLADNTLHFNLPAFVAKPGMAVSGEIVQR
jgi:hypothetical protein